VTDCEGIRMELSALAADDLAQAEADAVHEHLAGCPACARAFGHVREAAAALASAPLEHAPAPDLRDRVFSLVELEPVGRLVGGAAVEHDPPVDLERRALEHAGVSGHRSPGRWQRAGAVLAPGLAAALALLGWMGANWRSDANLAQSQLGPVGEPIGTAELTAEASSSSGPQVRLMRFSSEGYRLVLVCDGVPEAPPGHHYAVWLEGDLGRMPVGAFDIDGPEPVAYPFPVAVDPGEFRRVVVTLESEYGHALKPGVPMWVGEIDLGGATP
jgi:hypothetical protein